MLPVPTPDAEVAARAQALLQAYASEAESLGRHFFYPKKQLGDLQAGKAILSSDQRLQVAMVFAGIASAEDGRYWRFFPLVAQLLRRNLPFEPAELVWLVRFAAHMDPMMWKPPWASILKHVQRMAPGISDRTELNAALNEARQRLSEYSKNEKLIAEIDAITTGERPATIKVTIVPGESWSDLALAELFLLKGETQSDWNQLLAHAASASGSKPSAKWLKAASDACGSIGNKAVAERVVRWLSQIGQPGKNPTRNDPFMDRSTLETMICDSNSDLLKGLVWCVATIDDIELTRAIGGCAEASYKKIKNVGPRCAKLGNACVQALAIIGSPAAVSQIVRIKTRVKYSTVQSLINNALAAAAKRAGVSTDELQELAVPTHGLRADGTLRTALGQFTAELTIEGTDARLRWLKVDGRRQASIPKTVRDEHPELLKDLKATLSELKKALPAQRDRIQNLFLERRTWPLGAWRSRYLDHPLIQHSARRLIWSFGPEDDERAGIWHDGDLVSHAGDRLAVFDEETKVRLWHPIGRSTDEVLAWRNWLFEHEITQPFKQAHREVYLLTDAERQTETYSNRFAAHIIKQHQFAALCQQHGWRYSLMGAFDSHNTPTVRIPIWDLRAEFWVDAAGGAESETSHMGIYLYLSTDQVRFYRGNAGPMPLEAVPPIVFSEVMRNVDLFVGVCSIGNDPRWIDGGAEGHYGGYWNKYNFGELSAAAETRRDTLAQVLPKLRIASRCRIEDRYLLVKGDLRTYKIHLGSGNILMEPNDQYLCIVASRSTSPSAQDGKVFLPFEGDGTLAIILSKALMLANDRKITDPTIINQIQQR